MSTFARTFNSFFSLNTLQTDLSSFVRHPTTNNFDRKKKTNNFEQHKKSYLNFEHHYLVSDEPFQSM
jgi:hypothetical protein